MITTYTNAFLSSAPTVHRIPLQTFKIPTFGTVMSSITWARAQIKPSVLCLQRQQKPFDFFGTMRFFSDIFFQSLASIFIIDGPLRVFQHYAT